jgi:hypothetical protein
LVCVALITSATLSFITSFDPTIAAISTIMIVVTSLLLAVSQVFGGKKD